MSAHHPVSRRSFLLGSGGMALGLSFGLTQTELALAQGPLATVLHTAAILLMLLPFWIVRRDGGGPLLAFFAALVVASILAPFPMPLAGGVVSPLDGLG